jgi:hypothetical protein
MLKKDSFARNLKCIFHVFFNYAKSSTPIKMAVGGRGALPPLVLTLGTRLIGVINFTLRPP